MLVLKREQVRAVIRQDQLQLVQLSNQKSLGRALLRTSDRSPDHSFQERKTQRPLRAPHKRCRWRFFRLSQQRQQFRFIRSEIRGVRRCSCNSIILLAVHGMACLSCFDDSICTAFRTEFQNESTIDQEQSNSCVNGNYPSLARKYVQPRVRHIE